MTYVHTFIVQQIQFRMGYFTYIEKKYRTLIIELFIFKSVLKRQPIPSWNIMQSGPKLATARTAPVAVLGYC